MKQTSSRVGVGDGGTVLLLFLFLLFIMYLFTETGSKWCLRKGFLFPFCRLSVVFVQCVITATEEKELPVTEHFW